MSVLLIADKHMESRKQIADLLTDAGYTVIVTSSAAKAIYNVLIRTAHIVLLGMEVGEFSSAELVPILKKCNRNLIIILVSDDTSLPLIRKVRKEGIFYHALRPVEPESREELKQVVKCAIDNLAKLNVAFHAQLGPTMADGGDLIDKETTAGRKKNEHRH